eukprot:scaffold938_cov334-Pavlova_lutheri.AAC.26
MPYPVGFGFVRPGFGKGSDPLSKGRIRKGFLSFRRGRVGTGEGSSIFLRPPSPQRIHPYLP